MNSIPDQVDERPPEVRREHRKAELAARNQRQRDAVLRRILGGGVTAKQITDSLRRDLGDEWTRAGVESVLHDLASLGEAHVDDGRWSLGPAPEVQPEPEAPAAPPADPRAVVLQALGERTMARLSLAAYCAPHLELAAAMTVIARLIEERVLEPEIAGRVRLRREGVSAPAPVGVATRNGEAQAPAVHPVPPPAPATASRSPEALSPGEATGAGAPSEHALGSAPASGEVYTHVLDCDDTGTDTDEGAETQAPTEPDEDCDDSRTTAARIHALVTAEPGLSTQEIAARLRVRPKVASSSLQRGPYRRERVRNPDAAGGRGNTIARWFVDGPVPGPRGRRADGSPLRDRIVAVVGSSVGVAQRGSSPEDAPATSDPSPARPPTDPGASGDPIVDAWRERCIEAEALLDRLLDEGGVLPGWPRIARVGAAVERLRRAG